MKPGANVIVVRRVGGVSSCLARWFFVDAAVLALACGCAARRGAGDGGFYSGAIACAIALVGILSFLRWKALPGNTVIDMEGRAVRVRESGWRTEIIPFGDIDGIRAVTRGTRTGYALSLRGTDPARVMITDMLDENDAYRREFSLQLLPRLEDMLSRWS